MPTYKYFLKIIYLSQKENMPGSKISTDWEKCFLHSSILFPIRISWVWDGKKLKLHQSKSLNLGWFYSVKYFILEDRFPKEKGAHFPNCRAKVLPWSHLTKINEVFQNPSWRNLMQKQQFFIYILQIIYIYTHIYSILYIYMYTHAYI